MATTIEAMAEASVARGWGFASLAIGTCMIGLSDQMHVAFKSGGILLLIVCMVLVLSGVRARRVPYKRTELWLMLEPDQRPQAGVAQRLIGEALRDARLRYAYRSAVLALVLLAASIVL